MLTIVHSPTDYNLSRNSQYVEITTDNYMVTTNYGVAGQFVFFYLYNAVVNNTLTIVRNGTPVVFTFKATSNIAANELGIYPQSVGQTAEDWGIQIAGLIGSKVTIWPYYQVSFSYGRMLIRAVLPGTAYSLTGTTTTVPGALMYMLTNATDVFVTAPRPGYKIKMELFRETAANSAVFEKFYEFTKEPLSNTMKCDLARLIDVQLQYKLPVYGNFTASLCPQLCKQFYARITEMYGTPSVQQATTVTPSGFILVGGDGYTTIKYACLKAGFSPIDERTMTTQQLASFYLYYQLFLTRQPRSKLISRNQPEYLYFMFPYDLGGTASVKYTFYDSLGNVTTSIQHTTPTGIKGGNVWMFPMNYPTGIMMASTVAIFSVQVRDNFLNTAISEVFSYTFDDEIRMEEKFIFFTNSDGGVDTVRLFGEIDNDVDFESEIAERTWSPYDAMTDGQHETLSVRKTNSYKAWSGFKTEQELLYSEELFLSRKKWTVGSITGQFTEVPIIITSKKLKRHKTNSNLFGYVVEYYEDLSTEISEYSYQPIA